MLSTRSALILALAVLTSLGAAGLLYLAHLPTALIVFGALGALGVALRLFDSLIELCGQGAGSGRAEPVNGGRP
jgi:hypothetical protein